MWRSKTRSALNGSLSRNDDRRSGLATPRRLVTALSVVMFLVSVLTALPSRADFGRTETTWGVYGLGPTSYTGPIRNQVFAIEQVGNRIFVGGKFTETRPTSGASGVAQPYLAAFSATTGEFINSFRPRLNGPVYALEASPDGSKLFVGGEFGSVDGTAGTEALAALNPQTGAVVAGWRASLDRPSTSTPAVVLGLDLDGSSLYAVGNFYRVQGPGGTAALNLTRATKVSLRDGTPDRNWKPALRGGGVWAVNVSPDRSRVYLGGHFTSVNNQPDTAEFVAVDNAQGRPLSGMQPYQSNRPGRGYIQDIESVGNLVFAAGSEHVLYVFDSSNLRKRREHTTGDRQGRLTGGDYQDIEVVGDRVYAGCHCRGSHWADFNYRNPDGSIKSPLNPPTEAPIKFLAAYRASDGAYIPSFALDISGSSGVWAIHAASDGCLWVGGDLTRGRLRNGSNRALGGFGRFCDGAPAGGGPTPTTTSPTPTTPPVGSGGDDERPSAPRGLRATLANGQPALRWTASTDNVGVTSYAIHRSTDGSLGSVVQRVSTAGFTDTTARSGVRYTYAIKASDAAGNTSWRSNLTSVTPSAGSPNGGGVADSERPSAPTGLRRISSGPPSIRWTASTDNVGVTGYIVFRSTNGTLGGEVARTTQPNFIDPQASAGVRYTYAVKAFDAAGNTSWRSNLAAVTG